MIKTIVGGIGMAVVISIGMYGTFFMLAMLSDVLR